jgi:hypothetical protein
MRIALRCSLGLAVAAGVAPLALADPPTGPAPAPKTAGPEPAPAAAKPAASVEVWDGYVWKDEEGRVRIGDPVVAMGVMAGPAQIISGPLAKALEPLLTPAKSEFIFWNYALESDDSKALDDLPKALVQIRGHVVEDGVSGMSSNGGTRTMADGRLVTLETVDRDWLRAWSVFFREKASPWRIREDADPSKEGTRAFAPKALAALLAMRARPHVDEAAKKRAQAIGPDAVAAEGFRWREETQIQRWLAEENEKRGWGLAGLGDLPPLPPAPERIQALLMKGVTRAQFVASLGEIWKGDWALLDVSHYVKSPSDAGDSITWSSATAAEIRDHWTDEQYTARRAATIEIMRR